MSDFNLDGFDFDAWWEEYEKKKALNKLKRDNPLAADIIEVLLPYRNGLGRSWVIDAMEKRRKAKGLPIPPKFEASVQSAYNQHSVDSSVWLKRGSPEHDGLFYAPGGKGSGKWAVNRERAADWLKAKIA